MRGSHGTCKSRAIKIQADGQFKLPSAAKPPGKLGRGVYFWSYEEEDGENYGKRQATCWYEFCLKDGWYRRDSDRSKAVFLVEIDDNSTLLDFKDGRVENRYFEHYRKAIEKLDRELDRKVDQNQINNIMDRFILGLEKKLETEFGVVRGITNMPGKYLKANDPIKSSISLTCLAVRDVDLIRIDNVEM